MGGEEALVEPDIVDGVVVGAAGTTGAPIVEGGVDVVFGDCAGVVVLRAGVVEVVAEVVVVEMEDVVVVEMAIVVVVVVGGAAGPFMSSCTAGPSAPQLVAHDRTKTWC